MDAAFALDGLHKYGTGGGRDSLTYSVEIAIGYVPETFHCGSKAFLYLCLAGGRDACESAAVEGAQRGKDFKLSFLVIAQPCKFIECFIGFSSTVAEKYLTTAASQLNKFLCEYSLWLSVVEIGNMGKFTGLLGEGVGEFWMSVTKAGSGNP